MTLIEVIVAVALFGVLSSAVLVVITSMIDVSNDDGRRTVAGNLAARELEITREVFASQSRGPEQVVKGLNKNPLPGGAVGQPLVVDGIEYDVMTSIEEERLDQEFKNTCDQDNGDFAFKSVHVEVTWEGMNGRAPVVMDTIMTPPKGTYVNGSGHIGVKVIDALGKPRAGVTITATPKAPTVGVAASVVTSDDGCALLLNRPPGSYEVKASATGFVSQQGESTPTLSANVETGMLWKGTFFYDRATALDVTVCPPATDYPLPTSFNATAVSLGHPSLLPAGAKAFSTTGTRSKEHCEYRDTDGSGKGENRDAEVRRLTNLWPYPAGYQAWMGSCPSNDPSWTGYESSTRDSPIGVEPGKTSETMVSLQPVTVTLATLLANVEATPMTLNGDGDEVVCTTAPKIVLGKPSLLRTQFKTSLPYGLWRIQRSTGGASVIILVQKGDPAQAVAL